MHTLIVNKAEYKEVLNRALIQLRSGESRPHGGCLGCGYARDFRARDIVKKLRRLGFQDVWNDSNCRVACPLFEVARRMGLKNCHEFRMNNPGHVFRAEQVMCDMLFELGVTDDEE